MNFILRWLADVVARIVRTLDMPLCLALLALMVISLMVQYSAGNGSLRPYQIHRPNEAIFWAAIPRSRGKRLVKAKAVLEEELGPEAAETLMALLPPVG